MTTQLNTQTYSQINTEVTNLLKTGQYSGVNITIYVDAEGNVPATLNGNAVENRKIMKINSTASYKNKQGQTVKPCVDVHFTGNEIFKLAGLIFGVVLIPLAFLFLGFFKGAF